MKNPDRITKFTLALALFTFLAAQPLPAVVGPDGADYTFGNWSAPTLLSVPSEAGPLRLNKRTIKVTRRGKYPPYTKIDTVIDYLTSPLLDGAWIGPEVPAYFGFNHKIFGLYTSEGVVVASPGTLRAGGDLMSAVQKAVTNLGFSSLKGPHLDLEHVFGVGAIRPPRDARLFAKALTFQGAAVEHGLLTLTFKSMTGNDLRVEYDHDFEVQAAYENGHRVLVLGNGMLPVRPYWGCPSSITVTSPGEDLTAFRCSMDFDSGTPARKLAQWASIVVMPRDGTVWFGPDLCRLLVVGDQLVGIMRDNWMEPDRGELLVYASWDKIPVAYQGTTTAKGFQTALSDFNQQVQAKGLWGAFRLAKRLKLGELFPELAGTRALSGGCITIRSITFQGEAADILLESCEQWRVEVLLGPGLNVVGTRRLRWNHRPGQYTEVQKLP